MQKSHTLPFPFQSVRMAQHGTNTSEHRKCCNNVSPHSATGWWLLIRFWIFLWTTTNGWKNWMWKVGVKPLSLLKCFQSFQLCFSIAIGMHMQWLPMNKVPMLATWSGQLKLEKVSTISGLIKSYEAEQLFSKFLSQIFANIHYYSILQPIHNVLIFTLLQQHLDVVPFICSCNNSPLWCKRCPKCCCVWLSFQAYMPQHVIDPMFNNENLLDVEENQLYFMQILVLGGQKPFKCIGEIGEVQLAFEIYTS